MYYSDPIHQRPPGESTRASAAGAASVRGLGVADALPIDHPNAPRGASAHIVPVEPSISPLIGVNVRAMRCAELLGRHSHRTLSGIEIHVWRRGGKYLVRGRWEGRPFGKTLDSDPAKAGIQLMQILVGIENGTFHRPSEERRRPLKHGAVPRLDFRGLVDRHVAIIRRLRGKSTAQDYLSRLVPAIEFAERKENRTRWPHAADLDGSMDFALGLRTYVLNRTVARNGHPASVHRRTSARQVHNILSAVATMFNAAKRPDTHLLPMTFANPFTPSIIRDRPRRDPLAPPVVPSDLRLALVSAMDAWQLLTLSWSLVLPSRPDELAGLLISDVLPERRELVFAARWGGDDFNKARQSFRLAYPPEFDPLVRSLIVGRQDGPLLRRRTVISKVRQVRVGAGSTTELDAGFNAMLAQSAVGEVEAAADRKRLFRTMLRRIGGISGDCVAKEFKSLLTRVRPGATGRFYDLRGSVITDLRQAGVDWLLRLYVTGRSLKRETMADYESQDLHGGMARYFAHIQPLLSAIAARARELGIN